MTWLTFSNAGLRFYPALIMRQFSQSNPISQIIVFSSRLSEVSGFLLFLTFAFWRVYFQRREREIQQKLDEKEEDAVEIKGNYTSLQQEVDSKTKKLKKVNLF